MNRNVNKYKGEKSTSWTNFIYKYQRKFLVRILQLLLFSSILTTGLNFLALLVGLASIVNFHVDLSPFIFEFTVMLFVSFVLSAQNIHCYRKSLSFKYQECKIFTGLK